LRSHWSNVFIDDFNDLDAFLRTGGEAYSSYGISLDGAVIVVCLDGYVGLVTSLNAVKELDEYFSGFLIQAWGSYSALLIVRSEWIARTLFDDFCM